MRKIIENDWFGIIAMSILLIPQIAHTVYVFEANTHYDHPWFSWCYAVGVDLAILIFTVKGWLRTAFIYLFATLAHNLVYQFIPEGTLGSILLSIVQSTTLFSFCHLFFKRKTTGEPLNITGSPLTVKSLKIQKAMEAGVRFKPQPYICPECGEPFSRSKELNGHISTHKVQGEWKDDQYGDWKGENEKRAALL